MNKTRLEKCLKFENGAEFVIFSTVGNTTKAFKPFFKESKFRIVHKVVEIYWEAKSGLGGINCSDRGRDHRKKYRNRALQWVFCAGIYKMEIHKSDVT